MQFSTVVFALAASASAAVLPRTNQGSWNVHLTLGPDVKDLYLHAEFTNDEYNGDSKLRNTCAEAPNAELPVTHRCDQTTFDFSYDGAVLNLTETLPNGVTVFGSAPFSVHTSVSGDRFEDAQIIPVTSAIA